MARRNELGKVRQSNVIMNYGPGAVVDFRTPKSGAAISVVSASLDSWDKKYQEAGVSPSDLRKMTEPRLAEKLKVSHFRQPPIATDDKSDDSVIPIVGVRFPTWLQCPSCHELKQSRYWSSEPGDPARICSSCSAKSTDDKKVYAVPVRFVTACPQGHLDDFPWVWWVHQGNPSCSNKKKFRIRSEGAGLAGIVVSCEKCGSKRSMEDAFFPDAFKEFPVKCTGKRPWLVEGNEERCDQKMKTMQRGASNLYFPMLESSLMIPPWSEELVRKLGHNWGHLTSLKTRDDLVKYIDLTWHTFEDDFKPLTKDEFTTLVSAKIDQANKASSGNLRWDEYQQFMMAENAPPSRGTEFEIRNETVPDGLNYIEKLQRVVSLREIRALKGFSRIEPHPGSKYPVKQQFLATKNYGWLPASDNRGEGIFITLDKQSLKSWENQKEVVERVNQVKKLNESNILNPDSRTDFDAAPNLCARFLLLHSLAHVLMKQLSLQCGYSSASLRERIYIGDGKQFMAGILIFTSTSDSDGTLGGLQRQGKPERFKSMFVEAIRASEWCSSDPLCINGLASATEDTTLAACHSCLLVPETCCEDFNRFLDRAMLVGTPENRNIGFFARLADGSSEV